MRLGNVDFSDGQRRDLSEDVVREVFRRYGSALSRLVGLGTVLLAPVILLAPALRPGRVLSGADVALSWPMLSAARPLNWGGPVNALVGDSVLQFIPWRRFAVDELRAGRLPLWNPHAFAGSPLLANSLAGVLDPLAIPYFFSREPSRATVWVALLRLWVAGLGAWVLARRFGIGDGGAAVAGVAYGCGGFMIVWLLFPQAASAAWLPWTFVAAESLARKGGIRAVAALAVTLALSVFGGHPEISLAGALGASVFVVVRSIQERGRRAFPRVLGSIAAAAVFTIVLSAVQVLPLVGAIKEGALASSRAEAGVGIHEWKPPAWQRLAVLVFPSMLGRPERGEVNLAGVDTNVSEQSGTVLSLAGLAFALIGLFGGVGRSAHVARTLAGVALPFWLVYCGTEPFLSILRSLPILKLLPPERLPHVALLSFAILAAVGTDSLVSWVPRARRYALWLAVVVGAIGALGFIGGLWLRRPTSPFAAIVQTVQPFASIYGRLYLLPWAVAAVFTALLLLLAGLGHRSLIVLAPAVVAAGLIAFGRGFNPAIPADEAYPRTGALAALSSMANGGRVLVASGGLPPELATYYGVDDILGYNAIGRARYERLLQQACSFPPGPAHFRLSNFNCTDSLILDLLNVTALASPDRLATASLQHASLVDGINLYRRPSALSRALVPGFVETVRNAEEAEAQVGRTTDFGHQAVVEAEHTIEAGEGSVKYFRQDPGRIRLDVSMRRGGLVLISEAYDPGWRASLDLESTTVYPANIALLGVQVPSGTHRVELRYWPQGFTVAGLVSGLGWFGVGAIAMVRPRKEVAGARPTGAVSRDED